MGLRSPLDLAASATPTRAMTTARVQSVAPTAISTDGLDTLGKVVDRNEKQRLKAAQDAEKAAFQDAKTDLNLRTTEARQKAEAKVGSTIGVGAEDVRRKEEEAYVEFLQSQVDKYPERWRKDLSKVAYEQKNKYDKSTLMYSAKQMRDAQAKALDTQIANGIQDVVQFSGSEKDFSEGLESLRGYNLDRARKMYGTDPERVLETGLTVAETVAQETYAAVSSGVLRSVEFQASQDSLDRARQIMLGNVDNLTDQDKIKAHNAIKAAEDSSESREALDLSEDLWARNNGDLVKIQKEVVGLEGTNNKLYTKVMGFVKTKNYVNKEQKKSMEEDATTKIYEIASKGGDYSGVIKGLPADMQVKLRQEIADTLNKNGGKVDAVVTNWSKFDAAFKELHAGGGGEAIKNPNWIASKRGDIAPEQLSILQSEWARLYRSESNEVAKINRSTSLSVKGQFDDFVKANMIIDPDIIGPLQSKYMQYYDELITKNPKITARERELHMNKVLMEAKKEIGRERKLLTPSSWWSGKPVMGYDLPDAAPSINKDVDSSWPDIVRAQAKAKGRPEPTQEQIDKIIKANPNYFKNLKRGN